MQTHAILGDIATKRFVTLKATTMLQLPRGAAVGKDGRTAGLSITVVANHEVDNEQDRDLPPNPEEDLNRGAYAHNKEEDDDDEHSGAMDTDSESEYEYKKSSGRCYEWGESFHSSQCYSQHHR